MHCMILPWPAMKGASGSPVMVLGSGDQAEAPIAILGMVIENRESELLPARFEEIRNDAGETVERYHYFSPNALAIGADHLAKFAAEVLGPGSAPRRPIAP